MATFLPTAGAAKSARPAPKVSKKAVAKYGARAERLVMEMATTPLTKGDKYGHADSYRTAWKAISKLIAAEAKEMKGGDNELANIGALTRAMECLERFAQLEAAEGENVKDKFKNPDDNALAVAQQSLPVSPYTGSATTGDDVLARGVRPDLTKAHSATAADPAQIVGAVTGLIKAAGATMKPSEQAEWRQIAEAAAVKFLGVAPAAQVDARRADLAKAAALEASVTKATADMAALKAALAGHNRPPVRSGASGGRREVPAPCPEADRLEKMAESFAVTEPALADAYVEMAADARAKAGTVVAAPREFTPDEWIRRTGR